MLLNFEYEELFFENDGIRLHAVAAGPKRGPVVLLLHGFPEFWYGWRKQIGPLAAAGFRVIALDQRGYNLSSKPVAVSDYAAPLLTRDVICVADQLGCERFHLAGHDWGAAVAWTLALRYPERLHKLAILNVPHPAVMMHTLRTNPRQWLRSWYMLFFQLPWLPETAFSAFHFYGAARLLSRTSRPGAFTVEDLEVYRAAWSQPGALSATLTGIAPSLAIGQESMIRRCTRQPGFYGANRTGFSFPRWHRIVCGTVIRQSLSSFRMRPTGCSMRKTRG